MATKIIHSVPDMTPMASLLLHMTIGRLNDDLFGAGTPQETQGILEELFRLKSNRYSHQFAEAVITDGEVAGPILAYSCRTMKSLESPTARRLLRLTGGESIFLGLYELIHNKWPKYVDYRPIYVDHSLIDAGYQKLTKKRGRPEKVDLLLFLSY